MFRFLIILVFPFALPAQNKTIDSLKLELENAKYDTTRCNILSEIAEIATTDESIKYIEKLLELSERRLRITEKSDPEYKFYQNHLAVALSCLGYFASVEGDYIKSLAYSKRGLKNFEELGDIDGMATALCNIGSVYQDQGAIPQALECYYRTLKIDQQRNNKEGEATALNNIAMVYKEQGDIHNAIDYYESSLKIREEIGLKKEVASSLSNIGALYQDNGDISKAIEYHNKALKNCMELGDKKGISTYHNNIGLIYKIKGDFNAALKHLEISLNINEELGDKNGIANTLNNIGSILITNKEYSRALDYVNRSKNISVEIGFANYIKNAAGNLFVIYKSMGKHRLALQNYELYIQIRDSLNNESTRKASIKSQLKYEYEKQAAADSVAHAKESEIKNAELAKQKAEISARKNQQYALFGGLGLVMIFAGFMLNRFKVTQKQKEIIEQQKEVVEEKKKIVEEKQKEILDSIQYAKRIQMAQVPSENRVEKTLMRLRA